MIWRTVTYALVALLLGAVLTNCATHNRLQAERLGHSETKREYQEQELARAEVARLAEAGRRASERVFAADIESANQRTLHEIARLTADTERLARLVRNRPERPAAGGGQLPQSASGPVGCTGDRLYRADGEFLVGEDTAAENNLILLESCRARYDAAVKATAGF